MLRFGASQRQACTVLKLCSPVYSYQSVARDSVALIMGISEIAQTRVHYGHRRVHVMLRREGWRDSHKRGRRAGSVSAKVCSPMMATRPLSGTRAPDATAMKVNLPAPFSPTRPWTSPAGTGNVTLSGARTPGTKGLRDPIDLQN
jgi:putative transposase